MTVYQVEFSDDWIRGRWGFTDRVFNDLKGREADAILGRNTWVVNFQGTPSDLGGLLTEMLNIQTNDFQRFGTIFQITPLSDPDDSPLSASGSPSVADQQPTRPRPRDSQIRAPWERTTQHTRRPR